GAGRHEHPRRPGRRRWRHQRARRGLGGRAPGRLGGRAGGRRPAGRQAADLVARGRAARRGGRRLPRPGPRGRRAVRRARHRHRAGRTGVGRRLRVAGRPAAQAAPRPGARRAHRPGRGGGRRPAQPGGRRAGPRGPHPARRPPPGPGRGALARAARRRLADELRDRLAGPLAGSVYAGDCARLSLQVVAAQLAAARDLDPAEPSLIRSVIVLRDQAPVGERPLFLAPREGMGALVGALVDALGDAVRTGTAVEALVPEGTRWRLAPTDVTAGAVVLATPAFATAPLLAPLGGGAAEAAAAIGEIDHASVALVSLAVPRDGVEHELDGTGFLVPRSAGLLLTACSWVTTKWPHLDHDPSLVLLRASVGRDGDERALGLTDDELVARVLDDLGTTMGL